MFGPRYPYADLAQYARVLKTTINAGLPLPKIFEQLARSGPGTLRDASARIAQGIKRGDTLAEAFQRERQFPTVFSALVLAGEASGRLPEVAGSLETAYRDLAQNWRFFRQQMIKPAINYVAGILVMALVIFVLGIVSQGNDPIGLGLTGPVGAMIFLVIAGAFTATIFFVAKSIAASVENQSKWEGRLLAWPILGPCLHSQALQRFCLTMSLTTDSSMTISEATALGLTATTNQAFRASQAKIVKRLDQGQELAQALGVCSQFPNDLLGAITIGETSGNLAEVFAQQSAQYQERASEQMKRLTTTISYAIYGLVGIMIIVMIFILFTSYLGQLNVN